MPDITAEAGGLIVVAVVLILREIRNFVSGMGVNSPETMRGRVLTALEECTSHLRYVRNKADNIYDRLDEKLERNHDAIKDLAREVRELRDRRPDP